MYRQLSLSSTDALMYFAVKFYCPDPSRLEDELTRFESIDSNIMHAFYAIHWVIRLQEVYAVLMLCALNRYLFGLQIKKDLSEGLLICNENTAALMASYIIQGMTP